MKTKFILYILIYFVVNVTNLFSQWTLYNKSNSLVKTWTTVGGINQDIDGNYWVYQMGYGLIKFDGIKWIIFDNLLDTYGILNEFLPMTFDSSGNLWGGINGGLLLYDGNEYNGYLFRKLTGYNSNLPKNLDKVYSLVCDKNNILWLATSEKGIIRYDFNRNEVMEYNTSNTPLTSNTIKDILLDKEGNLWGLCGSNILPPDKIPSLFKFDWNTWTVYSKSNSGFSVSAPNCLAIDSTNNIWIGGAANFERFDGINWTNYQNIIKGPCKVMSWDVVDLDVDKNNNLWISTVYGQCGLFKFDGENWTNFSPDNSEIPDDHIMCTYVDHNNRIWIGTSTEGLAVYDNEPINIKEDKLPKQGFFMTPNPTEDRIRIGFHSIIYENRNISISNYMGNTVKEFNLNANEFQNTNEAELDVSDLPSGLYFATIRAGGQVQTEKFIILR